MTAEASASHAARAKTLPNNYARNSGVHYLPVLVKPLSVFSSFCVFEQHEYWPRKPTLLQNKGDLIMHPAFKFHISNYLISKHTIRTVLKID
jgi:hypothetical protein